MAQFNTKHWKTQTSTFPGVYKISKLKLIFKKGTRFDTKNYGPTFTFATSIENNWKTNTHSNW